MKKVEKRNYFRKKWKIASVLMILTVLGAGLVSCGQTGENSATTTGGEWKAVEEQGEDKSADSEEKTVTLGQSTLWETMNWMATTSTPTDYVIEEIFDMLFITNTDGTFDPRLADRWDVEGKEVTFYLNENALWHDGEPVTAKDVVYTFQLLSSSEASWLRQGTASYFEGTDEDGVELSEDSIAVEALDEHTVKLTLKQETDQLRVFSAYLRDVKILPAHLLAGIPDGEVANSDFWEHPVGSGPFRFDGQVDGERVEYVANEEYYLGSPKFHRLVIRFMDASTLAAALLNGEVDITADVSMSDLETLQNADSIQIDTCTSFQYQDLCLNLQDPVFTLNVRRAINAAINKQGLIDQLYKGYGEAAKSILPSRHPYYNENITEDTYDPAYATELLEQEQWDSDRVLELKVPQGNLARERSALLIQQDLQAVGIQTQIVTMDFATVLQDMRDNKYDLLLMGAAGTVDPADAGVSYFFHTEDEKFSRLWDEQAKGLTFEARKPYLDEYQEYFVEQVPGIVLYFPDRICYYNKRLSNIPVTDTDFWINKQSWNWDVAN